MDHAIPPAPLSAPERRRFLALCGAAGLGAAALGSLARAAEEAVAVDPAAIAACEKLAGLEFSADERELMARGLAELRESYRALRAVAVDNAIPPALVFDPDALLGRRPVDDRGEGVRLPAAARLERPADDAVLAFLPVSALSQLVRRRQVTSVELTELYLERLRRYGPKLECVISLTPERALAAARRADRELATGTWRGPLHGIPWGAKDLLAVRGYPTTWGATPYRTQRIDADAEVVRRLDAAGAVLVAKLTLGALAWGDVWFGGTTRNPWKLEQGSSGSSAGSAAATAAGLVGFAIGSETWGSIVSPSTRCGATGLRPTFGRVSRAGAMALSWSMDKLGPIARTVADTALVLDAIHGADPADPASRTRPFAWRPGRPASSLRVGFVPAHFEEEPEDDAAGEVRALDRAALDVVRELAGELLPVEMPSLPIDALSFILSAEAGAAFDELTRSGRDDQLVRQIEQAWPNVFRQARMIPAVEYVQANRLRTMLLRDLERALAGVDVLVAPSFAGNHLLMTNLTGHPAVVVPHGFRTDGTPASITFTGRLWGEAAALTLAEAYERRAGWHARHPPGFA